jgi:hypothetical protein
MGGDNLHDPVFWDPTLDIVDTTEIEVLHVETYHASRHTHHNVWRVYARHFWAPTLVLDRHSIPTSSGSR